MTITTIITTYRRPLLLKRAVSSVLKQTYSDFQVCVYDNASDDETEEVMRELVKKDPRVKYFRHPENIGMMANYKYAFDRIETPYFSFLSDDDFLLPNFYETALDGIRQFPDAGFSACGVLQLDESGNFVGDPLSLWAREGYYSAIDGLIEMIKTRFRFPVPTGVLFQTGIICDIKPNYNDGLDFFWDPDYLMRIAAKHPVVISKKPCAIYLAHTQSFASSFYSKLYDDPVLEEKYLTATKAAMRGMEEAQGPQSFKKNVSKRLFNKYVRQDALFFIQCFILQKKFRKAHAFSKRYYRHYGLSLSVLGYHVLLLIMKGVDIVLMRCFWLLAFLTPAAKPKIPDLNILKDSHGYGQKLLDDDF